jgi:hypothetical protein
MSKRIVTPPFQVASEDAVLDDVVVDADDKWVASCVTPEIASLIVRSVNAHSKLVELLERALPFIDDAADAHSVMSETCLAKECLQVVADIKAALASAKGMTE